jgi:hypothetical protein
MLHRSMPEWNACTSSQPGHLAPHRLRGVDLRLTEKRLCVGYKLGRRHPPQGEPLKFHIQRRDLFAQFF